MTMPQPVPTGTISDESLRWFENELHEARRFHETRLQDAPEYDDISVAIRRRSELAREEILDAIGRIHDGTFGICETCKVDIDVDRLEAMPQARFCLVCANRESQATSWR